MAILTINGAVMPSPSELSIVYKPIGKAETSASGLTVMDRIAIKRTITAGFSHLLPDAAEMLLSAAVKNALYFDLTFYDPMTAQDVTGTFRVTSCTVNPWRYADGVPIGYTGGQMTMEER